MSSLTDHIDPNQIVSSNLNMSSWLSFVWSSTQLNLLTNQKKLFCFFTKTLLMLGSKYPNYFYVYGSG